MSIYQDLRDALSDSWERFSSLDLLSRDWAGGWILAAVAGVIVSTVLAWKIMLPLIFLAVGVMFLMRYLRGEDSL